MARKAVAVERLVITGAAGRIARALRPLLLRPGRELVLVDTAPPEPVAGERTVLASVTDRRAMAAALDDAATLVHLAAFPSERPWPDIARVNIGGTRTALDAAAAAGVRRVLLASSIHAVGFTTVGEARDALMPAPRPDSYYGMSKVAVEALGSLYADRTGMRVVSARIGTFADRPRDARALSTWLSPADLARLVEAVAVLGGSGHDVVWAVSANARRVVDHRAGRRIGFFPVDDAEAFAASLGHPPPLGDDVRLGAALTTTPLGGAR